MARRNFGRPKAELVLSAEQRAALMAYETSTTTRYLALRARIVLLCAEGRTNEEVAALVGVQGVTVGKWRARFIRLGLEGLRDAPRPNAHRKLSPEKVEAVVRLVSEAAPQGRARWSTRAMAALAGVSQSSVSRLWARLPRETRENLGLKRANQEPSERIAS